MDRCHWYVLQVLTGSEDDVSRDLARRGATVLTPREHVTVRKGGKWNSRVRLLLPGYVLIRASSPVSLYGMVHAVSGIIRVLGNRGRPSPLTPEEERYWTTGDWEISRVHREPDGSWDILDGPLLQLKDDQIVRVSPHQRRARVRMTVGGITITKDLAVEVV
ncbi:transcription termination/antitermination NusG family protein [Anaeromassilibacillus senegalensis]|uniref:transcription termination/antitermination NusG family protein n=1 Tax=Anaeromassilibacillus senegalensis TaxID=1673717 RepID=UPI0006825452|nr:transcription termination/antitermination NusG family protein [Anaeromassilibacillus senegalensis]